MSVYHIIIETEEDQNSASFTKGIGKLIETLPVGFRFIGIRKSEDIKIDMVDKIIDTIIKELKEKWGGKLC